jgi:hypothetical protein
MRRPKPLFTPVINHVLCDIARFLSSFTTQSNGSGVGLAIRFRVFRQRFDSPRRSVLGVRSSLSPTF